MSSTPGNATLRWRRSYPACTGIFILPGKKGLGGRGRWLLIAGLSIPIAYLVIAVWL